MFKIVNNTFHVTRGDSGVITVKFKDGSTLPEGADVTFAVYRKNELDAEPVLFVRKSISSGETSVILLINSSDTFDIENPENGREEYWYELKIGPDNTVLGYDENGPKIFYLYPSGKTIEPI